MSVPALKLLFAPLVWRFLRETVRLESPVTGSPGRGVIYACLHRDILPAILYVRSAKPVLMVSPSADGDILVRALGERDYGFVRGASGQDGGRAFGQLRRLVAAGRCAGLAVDGPKGPFGTVREGVLQLARLTGAPIVPLRAVVRPKLVLGTWDHTVVPLPCGRVAMTVGPELILAPTAGVDDLAGVRETLALFFAGEGGT